MKEENSTSKNYLLVQNEGGREVTRNTKFYNLNMILAIGYHVCSNVGIQFRNWTNTVAELISKNYLYQEEITDLNRIVTMFLDHAEDMGRDKTLMAMND